LKVDVELKPFTPLLRPTYKRRACVSGLRSTHGGVRVWTYARVAGPWGPGPGPLPIMINFEVSTES